MIELPARFTREGGSATEESLRRVCLQVFEGVRQTVSPDRFGALFLGGPCASGTAEVLRTDRGEVPADELVFFPVYRRHDPWSEPFVQHRLVHLGTRLSAESGIALRLRPLPREPRPDSPPTLAACDLLDTHHRLAGDPAWREGWMDRSDPSRLPVEEASRLVLDRCGRLLSAVGRDARTGPDRAGAAAEATAGLDLARQVDLARLALGDAVLIALGRYHVDPVERRRRLAEPDLARMRTKEFSLDALRREDAGAPSHVRDPRDPRLDPRAEADEVLEMARSLWLWLEERRLGIAFPSLRDYAFTAVPLWREGVPFQHRVLTARALGFVAALGSEAGRSLRERLSRSFALLLLAPDILADAPSLVRLHRWLDTEAEDYAGLVGAYARLAAWAA